MPDGGLVLVLGSHPVWCIRPGFVTRTVSVPIAGQKTRQWRADQLPSDPCDSGPVTAALSSVLN